MRKQGGFTLIELLVVILILAILMAIALPLYLRAVRDSNRQTCRSNMQTIANALQAFRVRDVDHWYPGLAASTAGTIDFAADNFLDPASDLAALPQCPTDSVAGDADDYTATVDDNGQVTIMCNSDSATEATFHNDIDGDLTTTGDQLGFRPGIDAR
jgi:type IV pilus assembly protein PilA